MMGKETEASRSEVRSSRSPSSQVTELASDCIETAPHSGSKYSYNSNCVAARAKDGDFRDSEDKGQRHPVREPVNSSSFLTS